MTSWCLILLPSKRLNPLNCRDPLTPRAPISESDSVLVSSPLSSHLGPHDILPLPMPCPGHSILPSSPSPWEVYLYPCVPHHGAQREREICHFTVPKYWILELNFPIFNKSNDSSEILSFIWIVILPKYLSWYFMFPWNWVRKLLFIMNMEIQLKVLLTKTNYW